MGSKYDPLRIHLEDSTAAVVRLTMSHIERILGAPLPASARRHAAWWANDDTHSQAQAWLGAGFRTRDLDLNAASVAFVKG